ncbi:MAG: phospholipase D-like domain-containing protein, partial [Candidatus Ornithospirochaeta sp.]
NAVLIENTGARYIDVTSDENGDAYPLFHMKVMIVDNRYLVIGSTNFNFRSMALSHEIALVIDSPEIAKKVEEGVRGELGCPRELTLEELLEKKDEYGSFLGYLIVFFGG